MQMWHWILQTVFKIKKEQKNCPEEGVKFSVSMGKNLL